MKKALVVLLAVAMVFAFATSAMAFSDISAEASKTQDAINRFAAYGVINGYEDGTFGPDNTITRAEFATIVIRYTGNEILADALKTAASEFTDVKAGEWYAGYVNAAVALGYFQGMGDGTFGVAANVTYDQVVTVMLRLAGYTDALPGAWPYNYIAQASKVGLVQAATDFAAGSAATRKDVVLIAAEALDAKTVAYNDTTKKFVEEAATVKAAYNALKDAAAAELTLTYDAKKGVLVNGKALADTVSVSDGYGIFDLGGKTAALYFDADGKVSFIDLAGKYIKGAVTAAADTTKKTIAVAGKTYTYTCTDPTQTKGTLVEITLAAGKVAGIDTLTEGAKGVIVTKVEVRNGATAITGLYVNSGAAADFAVAKDDTVIVIKDGAQIGLDKIAVGDLVYARTIAAEKGFEVLAPYGEFGVASINSDGTNITSYVIDGISYTGAPVISEAGAALTDMTLAKYTSADASLKGVVGTFYTDKYGKAVGLVYAKAPEAKTSTVYGYVMDATLYSTAGTAGSLGTPIGASTPVGFSDITVLGQDGETVKYAVKDYNKKDVYEALFADHTGIGLKAASAALAKFDFVQVTVDADGYLTDIVAAAAGTAATSYNDKLNIIVVSGTSYDLPAATPVFNVTKDNGKIKSVKGGTAADAIAALKADATKASLAIDAKGKILYVILTDASVAPTPATYAVLESRFFDGSLVKFEGMDAIAKAKTITEAGVAGDIVTYKLTDGKVSEIAVKVAASAIAALDVDSNKVTGVSGAVVTTNGGQFYFDAKTVVYVYDKDGKFVEMGTTEDIAKDVYAVAYELQDNVAKYVVVIK